MKFPIKFKIVALGAVLSILVTTIALIFSNVEYRRRGRDNQINTINHWLNNMEEDFIPTSNGDGYLKSVKKIKDYILTQYEKDPSDPPEGADFENQKLYYKTRFDWLYAIEGLGMHYMSPEEIDFREEYQELLFLLADAKTATRAETVYTAFLTEDNKLFYIGDEYSYKKVNREDSHLPGSRYYNFPGEFTLNNHFYDCDFDSLKNRVLPIMENDEAVAYIFVQYNFNEVDADANSLMVTEIIALSITSLFMIVAYAFGAHFLLLRNINKLSRSASAFSDDLTAGKPLEKKDPNIKSNDEISDLSHAFITLEEDIIKYINVIQKEAQEKERANAELSVATNIQLSALPSRNYDDKNVTVRAFIKSAKEVGGDFYDYFYLDDHRLAIIISDVSGKGIPAALFMMKSKELIKSAIHANDNLVDAAKEVNTTLVNNNKEGLFVTSFLGIIDFSKNTITYVNAGHEKPYIVSNKKVTKLEGESNFVMGGEEDFIYKQEAHSFKKGEFIFLFTDGLNESINSKEEEFSYERIEETLDNSKNLPLNKVIENMNESLNAFTGCEEQFDDVTMVIVKNRDDKLHLSYDKKDYDIITEIVDRFNEEFTHLPNEAKASTGIIIDELVNNLITYEKREDLKIDIDFEVIKDDLVVVVSSNGADYNPFINHQEKYEKEFKPEMEAGGFGLSLIKDFAKSWDYRYENNHSIITITVPLKK